MEACALSGGFASDSVSRLGTVHSVCDDLAAKERSRKTCAELPNVLD